LQGFRHAVLQGDLQHALGVLNAAQPLFEPNRFDETKYTLEMLGGNYSGYLNRRLQHPDSTAENEFVMKSFSSESQLFIVPKETTRKQKNILQKHVMCWKRN